MSTNGQSDGSVGTTKVSLWTIAREWTRLGCIGFGGPPAHIALLRQLCVERRGGWTPRVRGRHRGLNLMPGPASTQLAIFCAWRLRRTVGAILGGICFVFPGLVLILLLSAVFLAHYPPLWILGAAAGAGAAVPAVALSAASGFVPASWKRAGTSRGKRTRWLLYGLIGGTATAAIGPYLVLVLLTCGLFEIVIRHEGGTS